MRNQLEKIKLLYASWNHRIINPVTRSTKENPDEPCNQLTIESKQRNHNTNKNTGLSKEQGSEPSKPIHLGLFDTLHRYG